MKNKPRYTNFSDEMKSTYGNLGDGVSLAGQLCPSCKGGRTGERTLSVWKEGRILKWKCWRASCPFYGSTVNMSSMHQEVEVPQKSIFTFPKTELIGPSIKDWIRSTYGIEGDLLARGGIKVALVGLTRRLYLPIFKYDGTVIGYVARALHKDTKPKTLTYQSEPSMSWYHQPSSDTLCIVEDQLSALRLSRYVGAVALLSTNLSQVRVKEIAASSYKKVFLMLDADAFGKAAKLAMDYKDTLKMILVKLPKDVKNMKEEEELIDLLAKEDIL